uniref:Uncharacterized protein n=1 Tax=Anopheles epiroticus TaxID=199890 RepID=A0A182PVN9_9DIPT
DDKENESETIGQDLNVLSNISNLGVETSFEEQNCTNCNEKDVEITKLEQKITQEQQRSKELLNANLHYDTAVQEIKQLKKQNIKLTKDLQHYKINSVDSSDVVPRMKIMLKSTLSSNQIDLVIKKETSHMD